MADKNTKDPNAAQDQLRGGTEGGGNAANLPNVGGPAGGTNSISPQGGNHVGRPEQHGGGTRTESRHEPEELFDGSRKPSHAAAKQTARDDADVNTTSGIPSAPGNPKQHDETDPTGQSRSSGAFTTDGSLKSGTGGHKQDKPVGSGPGPRGDTGTTSV
jgi:hypothetical protein